MQVDSRGSVYIFSQSRGDNRAAELLPQRIRARGEPFGLSSVVPAICRARPLWRPLLNYPQKQGVVVKNLQYVT